MHDSLTHLANRTSFNEQLDACLAQAEHNACEPAVVTIDLDSFKDINDTHGHAVGDEVLRQLAKRMTNTLLEGEVACRLGGDEFAVSKILSSRQDLADLLARLDDCLHKPLDLAPFTIIAGASLGVAVYPNDGAKREQLLNNADVAMYRAKASIGEHVCFYEPRMDESARFRRSLATDLN